MRARRAVQPAATGAGVRYNEGGTAVIQRMLVLVFLAIAVAGCSVRSISDSGYYADPDRGSQRRSNPFYKGELSEYNVLGIDPKASVSEEQIRDALEAKRSLTMPKGSSVMLVQSGAMIPDDPMVAGLEKYYNVSVFTGVPEQGSTSADSYSKALRLAAARAGAAKLIVYWGLLETGRQDLGTKAVSWFPVVGGLLPDETQRMRIRLKVSVVDVKTGQWETFSPEPFEDTDASGRYTRVSSDQAQVAILKQKGYTAAAQDIVKRYAR